MNKRGINSFIVLKSNLQQFSLSRGKFLKELAKELCTDYMQSRLTYRSLPRPVRTRICEVLNLPQEEQLRHQLEVRKVF